ncbi:MAG: nucleoside triphosphate pyrophosphohydrolase family protein [Planctomycetota bacterium]|jgi:hypothetical protein
MRTTVFVLAIVVVLATSGLPSFAESWVKRTRYDEGHEKTEGKRDADAAGGIFSRRWVDANNLGLSCAAWSRAQKQLDTSSSKPQITAYDLHVKQRYDWHGREPPPALFTCEWTETFYMENAGDCDNHSVFNGKGAADAYADTSLCFSDGPDNGLQTRYGVNLRTTASNREGKISKNPQGQMKFGCMGGIGAEVNWENRPDRGKAWQSAAGDIISFSAGMDNGHGGLISDNLWVKAYSGARLRAQTQEKAAHSYASVFHELAGFDLKIDEVLGEQAETDRPYPPWRQPGEYAAFTELKETWRKAAENSGLHVRKINMVINYLDRAVEPGDCQRLDQSRLAQSIGLYLEQFKDTFSGKYDAEACYWMAWLLAEAAKRPATTDKETEEARASFEALVEKVIEVLETKAQDAMGDANYAQYRTTVDIELARTEGRLRKYFDQLHNDALFPALKKPLDEKAEGEVLGRVRKDRILDSLLNRQMRRVSDEEFYQKWLRFYFDHIPERVVFWLVVQATKPDLRRAEYWGGMHHRASSCGEGAWPIEMYLIRIGI